MPSILDTLDAAFREAFVAMGYPAQIAGVQESTRGDAPFQCNGAMGAAGIAKKRGEKVNPRDIAGHAIEALNACLLYTSPSPRDATLSRMPSSA